MRDHESGFGIKDALVSMVFPRRCPVCDEPVPIGEGLICSQCRTKPQYIREPRCRRCGKQLAGGTTGYCRDCTRHRHVYVYGYALFDYQSL